MKVNNANISDFILQLSNEVVKILKNQEKFCRDLGLLETNLEPLA
ncbi:hypothetical protein [Campylobacter sputorum]|nr:hypothetical protein [Campylobacter sp. RM12321]